MPKAARSDSHRVGTEKGIARTGQKEGEEKGQGGGSEGTRLGLASSLALAGPSPGCPGED